MPYRTEHDTREARREGLAQALAAVRDDRAHERGEDRDLDGEEDRLLRALRELGLPRKRARLPLLSWPELRVASPCTEDWNAMVGDDRIRHCSKCERDVFDLSVMTSAQVSELLAARGEDPCVRFFRRADGTILTADECPTPSRTRAQRAIAIAACAVAAVAAVGAVAAHEARENHARPAQAPVLQPSDWWMPPHDRGAYVMGGVERGPRIGSHPPGPVPPWDRPDIVAEGARGLAELRGIDRLGDDVQAAED